jgi:hypothetical protein
MGIDNSNIQRLSAFYHALGKVLTEENNSIAGEKYKSAHSVKTGEVWVDSIGYSADISSAESEATLNDAVTMVGSTSAPAIMYPLQGSNYQAWFLDTGTPTVTLTGCIPSDGWVKPLINPSDVTNTSGAPSNGFLFKMYRPNGADVNYLSTFWDVDYYAGIIKFQPSATPGDATSNLGFTTTALNGTNTANLGALQTMLNNTTTGGPHGLAFQYTGQLLDDFLDNLPTEGGGSSGSDEWQSSVNGYLIEIGENQTIDGKTDMDDQIEYLNTIYDKYFIKTDDSGNPFTPPSNWSGITDPNTYFEFNGSSFSEYILTTDDDSNRFLLVDNTIELDVIEISATGSVSEFPSTTIQPDRIIEYTGTATSGLTYSAWQVTEPRLGMVTTLDDQESNMVRYVGPGTGWVEFVYELTYKVNSQKNMEALTTTTDFDLAIDDVVEFEPSGDKSIDVLVNGVQMPTDYYVFAGIGVQTGTYSSDFQDAGMNLFSFTDSNIFPNGIGIGDYVSITTTTTTIQRQITSYYYAGLTNPVGEYQIVYDGSGITNIVEFFAYTRVNRTNGVARQGDSLLWIGSTWYELTGVAPKDLVTFNYVTRDPSALNA